MFAHGVNNVYEGVGNIYNGPGALSVVGPIRKIYQEQLEDPQTGNMAYYSLDIDPGVDQFGPQTQFGAVVSPRPSQLSNGL